MNNDFELLKRSILDQAEVHKFCRSFMNGTDSAKNYAELRTVLYKFWPSFIMEYRKEVLEFLERDYERFKSIFHSMWIYFNEDADDGRAIFHKESNSPCYTIGRHAEGWAFGQSCVKAVYMSKLIGRDKSVCYYEQRARGQLFNDCVGRLYDGSSVSLNDNATIYARSAHCTFVSGGSSTVYAKSFRRGKAFGKSIVKGPSDKNLQLFDEAKYIKMEV